MAGWQDDLLREARVARLATVDAAGQPHVVPVCFVYLNGCIYTAVDEKPKRGDPARLRRIRNIEANGKASLVVDRYAEDWAQLAWVQLRGTAGLATAPDERAAAIAALRAKYPQYVSMRLEALPLIRLQPGRVVAWRAQSPK